MWYIIISSYELLIIKALTMKLIFLESSRLEKKKFSFNTLYFIFIEWILININYLILK